LAGLDFAVGADDADGADGRILPVSAIAGTPPKNARGAARGARRDCGRGLGLDRIEFGDPLQGLARDRRGTRRRKFVEALRTCAQQNASSTSPRSASAR
jgi:hypothetical protein